MSFNLFYISYYIFILIVILVCYRKPVQIFR